MATRLMMSAFDDSRSANGEYYVRARARARPRNSWFFWLGPQHRAGARQVTFIP
jgi:hypothetical protein